uniref:ATP synthase subunit b, chloroplastic n=1 Tax=Udotea sp. TZ0819 TaxID=2364085 RepID=A0A386B272_9CHLO|nr:ATP synthase CF0 subunit I [Udotea sp. TZ0819]
MTVGVYKQIFLKRILLIIIVIFFVGKTVKSLLSKRQKSILRNLRQSKRTKIEVKQSLLDVQTKIGKVSEEALEIQQNTDESIRQQKEQYQTQMLTDLQRLEEFQKSTINFQQRQIRKQISQKIIDSTVQKVDKKLKDNFNEAIKKVVSFWSVEKFKNL